MAFPLLWAAGPGRGSATSALDEGYSLARTATMGADLLLGNDAANQLSGLAGDNVMDGRVGADTLLGGGGADLFRLWSIEQGDTIADFESNIDKLDLSGIGVDFTFIGSATFTGGAGELRFADGQLQGDANGDLMADLLVTINGDPIVLSDLILA
jgi:serralysin